MSLLSKILDHTRQDLKARQSAVPLSQVEEVLQARPATQGAFFKALQGGRQAGRPRLIAELKKASPSRGILIEDYQVANLAQHYGQAAVALSVLTEPHFFLGGLDDLKTAVAAQTRPVLRKDFIIDPYQIAEARAAGASAVLLIGAVLARAQLGELLAACRRYGLDALVEVHESAELEAALAARPAIIGINNRNLHSFAVNNQTVIDLSGRLTAEPVVIVAESGYLTPQDLQPICGLVDACLIGEGLSRDAGLWDYFNAH